ncbi:hypothetical protein JCM33374_g3503 [Metschnikowia sp. JCM 33374]|nr:hypothetical protein JCM33374_g3503 [Metschnikowia sp. JCM 33374]
MIWAKILQIIAAFVSFTSAITRMSRCTSHPGIKTRFLPKVYHPQTDVIRNSQSTILPCPYEHFSVAELTKNYYTMTVSFWRPHENTRHYNDDFPPKIIGHKAKLAPEEMEKLLQDYMRDVLDIFENRGADPEEWRAALGNISTEVLHCDVSDPQHRTVSGLSLGEYAEEIQKAINFLNGTYHTLRTGLYDTDRPTAVKAFEQHLTRIVHNMGVAVYFRKPAAIMEQKWRSYFLVSLAKERLSPLTLEDHNVFERFCHIYNMIHIEHMGTGPIGEEASAQKESPCGKKWREAFEKFEYSIFGNNDREKDV